MYTIAAAIVSSMMAPALPDIKAQFHISSETEVALTLSIFLLSFAISPLVCAPLSEMFGRKWVSTLIKVPYPVIFKLPSVGPSHKQHTICRVQPRLCIRAIRILPHRIPVPLYVRSQPRCVSSEKGAGGWTGGAPIAVGGGVVGDVFAAEDRAVAMAIYTLGPVIGESR